MRHKILVFVAVAVVVALGSHVAAADGDAGGSYVDPILKDRQRCLDRPGRPEWMMVQSIEFQWRVELAAKYRSFYRASVISEADGCSCDKMYPDWDEHMTEVEQLWDGVSESSRWEWDNETRQRFYAARDRMTDFSSPRLMTVVRLCENLE